MHHAFTSPKPEHAGSVESDPGAVLADAYDVVCNGNEIGGGSIRIHRRDVQQQVFKVMGIDEAAAQEKFGFLLDAFSYGAPRTAGWRSAGIAWWRCWPGWTPSARSSRSRSPAAVSTR